MYQIKDLNFPHIFAYYTAYKIILVVSLIDIDRNELFQFLLYNK